MKYLLLLLILLPSIVKAQTPVEWKAWAMPVGQSVYALHVHGKVLKGWHVYAKADTSLGLEPLTVGWDNENLIKDDTALSSGKNGNAFLDYKDPVFDHKVVKIYSGEINLEWNIKVDGLVPSSFPITIKGFASNDKEFVMIEETKEISLPGGSTIPDNK